MSSQEMAEAEIPRMDVDFISMEVPIERIVDFGTCFLSMANYMDLKDTTFTVNDCLFIGRSSWVLIVHNRFKDAIVDAWIRVLNRPIASSANPCFLFFRSGLPLGARELIRVLGRAGVPCCRMYSYGMKSEPRNFSAISSNPIPLETSLSNLNSYDIGMNHGRMCIPVFTANGIRGCQIYPYLTGVVPEAGGGSLAFEYYGLRIKAYPRLVHFLKQLGTFDSPGTMVTMRRRRALFNELRARIEETVEIDPYLLGGYRLEVSTTAVSLDAALIRASAVFEGMSEESIDSPMRILYVTFDDYFANVDAVLRMADEMGVFIADDRARVDRPRLSIYYDILSAFGYSSRSTPSSCTSIDALRLRWRQELGLEMVPPPNVFMVQDALANYFAELTAGYMRPSRKYDFNTLSDSTLYRLVRLHQRVNGEETRIPWSDYIGHLQAIGVAVPTGSVLRLRFRNILEGIDRMRAATERGPPDV
jgi:hypothetical protein